MLRLPDSASGSDGRESQMGESVDLDLSLMGRGRDFTVDLGAVDRDGEIALQVGLRGRSEQDEQRQSEPQPSALVGRAGHQHLGVLLVGM